MNILLVSECSKKALPETRRILDQFAERKGSRTWQTPITDEGLKTLRKLLKKSARRNTAVACHWIRSKNHTELKWIVGNRRKFNIDGTVPTNITQRNILRSGDESVMNSIQSSALMAGIAGLFHDFGKANQLFQNKLNPKSKGPNYEPYRHEWLSSLMFINFVAGRSDHDWLTHLANLGPNDDAEVVKLSRTQEINFNKLDSSPLAQCVLWLILSHHRLPRHHLNNMDLNDVNAWLSGVDAYWNALNHQEENPQRLQAVFSFPNGTPILSVTWRKKAKELAKRALNQANLSEYASLDKAHPLHVARMALMLADHAYSSSEPTSYWQDTNYRTYANTYRNATKDKVKGELKQKLDEHCIGVAHHAYILARTLPKLRPSMPIIAQHRGFKRRSKIQKFRWQDNAYDLAVSVAEHTQQQGFFGVNMASTGKGKTFANARIMYGLANPQLGCRFSVALGLRSLTLQTGEAFRARLNLDSDDLAVHIGSQAVKQLFDSKEDAQKTMNSGSESEYTFSEHEYVRYDGEIESTHLQRWLQERGPTHQLVSAPISVSTIDHLINASEGVNGGQQIAPMLRLMTSDLVLDEPDDFSLDDLPALARLVYFAGLLGARVLLSSATLPPSLIKHLFCSYQSGRQQYNRVTGAQLDHPIICAWFDEFQSSTEQVVDGEMFMTAHTSFTLKRHQSLIKHAEHLHRGAWLRLPQPQENEQLIDQVANTLLEGVAQLCSLHTTRANSDTALLKGKSVSCGLIRMANIEPLVAVGQQMLSVAAPNNTRIHYCIYHSQHPLCVRSAIEEQLDTLLQRDKTDPFAIFDTDIVQQACQQYPEQHHVFVVLATPVAEVGRDHDYDWAIVEPSSMRSIIQLAGRVQRHRRLAPQMPNILVLNRNVCSLRGKSPAYCRPGFESTKTFSTKEHKIPLLLSSQELSEQLADDELDEISSAPRFLKPSRLFQRGRIKGFIELEHVALNIQLRETVQPWNEHRHAHLFAEFQKQTQFRRSSPTEDYVCRIDEDDHEMSFWQWSKREREWVEAGNFVMFQDFRVGKGNATWGATTLLAEVERLSLKQDESYFDVCNTFASISLRTPTNNELSQVWFYHTVLGFFTGKDMNKERM